MGRYSKFKIFSLILIYVVLILSTLSYINSFTLQDNNNIYLKSRSKSHLKKANSWEIDPLVIDDTDPAKNWSIIESTYSWCTGAGNISNPYVIKDLIIDAQQNGSCISIKHSSKYFLIQNCTFLNSGEQFNGYITKAGIKLEEVSNGVILENNCSFNNGCGVILNNSNNNKIIDNIIESNQYLGIFLLNSADNNISSNRIYGIRTDDYGIGLYENSDNNHISLNMIDNFIIGIIISSGDNNELLLNEIKENQNGIRLGQSNNNLIHNNTIDENEYGIHLIFSNNNNVRFNNLFGNEHCITEESCFGNIIEDNNCHAVPEIAGYELMLMFSITLAVSVLFLIRLKKTSIIL
jgi:parallel beta-helix repeat protein